MFLKNVRKSGIILKFELKQKYSLFLLKTLRIELSFLNAVINVIV